MQSKDSLKQARLVALSRNSYWEFEKGKSLDQLNPAAGYLTIRQQFTKLGSSQAKPEQGSVEPQPTTTQLDGIYRKTEHRQ